MSTTVWVARMVMEKERLEGAEAAGGVVRQSEIWVLAPCMIKIRPKCASCGFRNLGARVIPMKFNDNVKRVLFGAKLFPFQ